MDERIVVEKSRKQHKRKKRRVVSGALLEEGDSRRLRGMRGGEKYEDSEDEARFKKKRLCMYPSHEQSLSTELYDQGSGLELGLLSL